MESFSLSTSRLYQEREREREKNATFIDGVVTITVKIINEHEEEEEQTKKKQVETRIYFTIYIELLYNFMSFLNYFLVKLQHTETDLKAENPLTRIKGSGHTNYKT